MEAATVFFDELAIVFDDPYHFCAKGFKSGGKDLSKAYDLGDAMRDEYDIEKLNPRRNPYVKYLKKQITININNDTIDYFKEMSQRCGIPYQTLMNLYLTDCAQKKKELELNWE